MKYTMPQLLDVATGLIAEHHLPSTVIAVCTRTGVTVGGPIRDSIPALETTLRLVETYPGTWEGSTPGGVPITVMPS